MYNTTTLLPARRSRSSVRWGWITAIALGCLLGLVLATALGETGGRLGPPDAFDLLGLEAGSSAP
jgi:hypothetical protein